MHWLELHPCLFTSVVALVSFLAGFLAGALGALYFLIGAADCDREELDWWPS